MRFWLAPAAAAFFLIASGPAHAEAPRDLRHDTRVDIAVTLTGATWWLTTELLKGALVPEKCRWCYRAQDGASLLNPYDGAVRNALLWEDTRAAHVTSNVVAFAIEPLSALGLNVLAASDEDALSNAPLDALIVAEATVVAGVINQLAKFGFARERPFVHHLPRAPDAVRALTDSPSDDNLSFFSGHTTLGFVMATSSGTVAFMRGYRLAPLVLGSGLVMATSVGYLRIAADKHYFSDVMTAAIVGSIIGIGVPLIFHSPEASSPSTSAAALASPAMRTAALASPAMRTAFSMSGKF